MGDTGNRSWEVNVRLWRYLLHERSCRRVGSTIPGRSFRGWTRDERLGWGSWEEVEKI
jgi:hypothetical protein